MKHIHILGICGTFMGGLARIAVTLGYKVTGSDANTYPPMSTQLEQLGIELYEGYDEAQLDPQPDLVVIGNAMSRGNPAVEYILNKRIPYTSGPEWLYSHVLKDKWVLAVSGTHGKTTTSSMLAWVLEYCGYQPGYLIGGVPSNFDTSAKVTDSPFFVIEADEYDSAFFDKRSKMIHYHPRTLCVNNLEFDHADIFKDLAAIQTQFHHLIRTIPGLGKIVYPVTDNNIATVMEMGCWSETETLGNNADWQTKLLEEDGSHFQIQNSNAKITVDVNWELIGEHNVSNGLMALVAARHVGVLPEHAAEALNEFQGVSRRMELKTQVGDVCLYDDFAHHPTAIKSTLDGLRKKVASKRIIAILEPRSNTMRMGFHKNALIDSLQQADKIWIYLAKNIRWDLPESLANDPRVIRADSVDSIVNEVMDSIAGNEQIVVMSNGSFDGVTEKLKLRLENENDK